MQENKKFTKHKPKASEGENVIVTLFIMLWSIIIVVALIVLSVNYPLIFFAILILAVLVGTGIAIKIVLTKDVEPFS